ncbi:uracil-DNA glycosylase [Oxalobacteraceae bacterium]|nr:uracil-DNA glycosylase [Oxalobacteraceae bacterium]
MADVDASEAVDEPLVGLSSAAAFAQAVADAIRPDGLASAQTPHAADGDAATSSQTAVPSEPADAAKAMPVQARSDTAADALEEAAPAHARSQPHTATEQGDDDSTAWFDDAPAPARSTPVTNEAIAAMDWPELNAAIASCTRCELCATRRKAVPGRGPATAGWMALGAAPSRLDEKEGRAITGESGQLLENMFKAIRLVPDNEVFVSTLVKCRPAGADGADRAAAPEELAACRPFLERELALTGATMLMTLGQGAAKGLLGAAARGKVLRYGALPVVATYHPYDLLRKPEDKAKTWADLCLARAACDGHA